MFFNFQRHQHFFNKDGNNLYCSCGEIRRMQCDHLWTLQKEEMILRPVIGGKAKQMVQTHLCEKCGEFKFINTTQGQETMKPPEFK